MPTMVCIPQVNSPAVDNRVVWRLFVILVLIVGDVGVNSSTDYDVDVVGGEDVGLSSLLLFTLGILIQAAMIGVFFSALSGTLPFAVGLGGLIMERFKGLLAVDALHLLLTCFAGGMRVVQIRTEGLGTRQLLDMPFYMVLSSVQKLVAPIYYALNICAIYELGKPMYYTKDEWARGSSIVQAKALRLIELREKYRVGM